MYFPGGGVDMHNQSFRETAFKIAKEYLWRERHETDPEWLAEIRATAERIKEARNFDEIVTAFIDACWDLPAFEDFITSIDIPREHRIVLLGIAREREEEWST
jgi:hypothetical protein